MYCTVYTTGAGSVVYINPNCNMKLIYEYLRVVTEVPDIKEIDLCTESGRLLGLYEAPCSTNGLQYFKPRANYFVLTFDYVEGTGELLNPQTLMHHANQDFEAVFALIKKSFGIPPNEHVDESDAGLIFEHLLMAYQEHGGNYVDSVESHQSKRSGDKKKRHGSKSALETNVLGRWRDEKRAKLATLRMEESEVSFLKATSSVNEEPKAKEVTLGEANEEYLGEVEKKKSDEPAQVAPTNGKKTSKKATKKSKKEKQEAKLLQAVPKNSITSTTSKPRGQPTNLELQRSKDAATSERSILYKLKSTLSNYYIKLDDPNPPHLVSDSIRQFFRDYPNSFSLPTPVAGSSTRISQTPKRSQKLSKKKNKKKKKLIVSSCKKVKDRFG